MPDFDVERLARQVAAHILDAFNAVEFGDRLADRVAEKVNADLEIFSMQGWHTEHVSPAWSGYCWFGEHDSCNGAAPPSDHGCRCPHHAGEPVPELGYRLLLVERTADDDRAEGGEPRV